MNELKTDSQIFHRIANTRRAVRKYLPESVPEALIRSCIRTAILAPSSSNLQLWEYYHVKDPLKKAALVEACFHQPAAATAPNLIVLVTRHDLWKQRCEANLDFISGIQTESSVERPIKATTYFKKTIPALYFDIFGVLGALKKLSAFIIGMFRPMYREVSACDVRTMSHKSVALSAQTFMLALAAHGYDSCPMEGIDSYRIRKLLNLPRGAYINMVISCGKKAPGGIYTTRFRLPFKDIYFKV